VILVLNQICSIISYNPVIEVIIGVLFLPYYNSEWEELAKSDIKLPCYSYKWILPPEPSTINECKLLFLC